MRGAVSAKIGPMAQALLAKKRHLAKDAASALDLAVAELEEKANHKEAVDYEEIGRASCRERV